MAQVKKWSLEQSTRGERKDPFVPINCGAIPENLIESELFGHVQGAFTGANQDKEGLLTAAEKGTVFLDEIAELPMLMQVKLLRVLQERQVRPVGANQDHQIRCRFLAATNRDLEEEVREGRFREDLFFRLNIIPIHLPPLRDRKQDIPLLAESFLVKYCEEQDRNGRHRRRCHGSVGRLEVAGKCSRIGKHH